MRQDPDVILVGELRDSETFEAAIHAAETGPPGVRHDPRLQRRQTINRILDLFPPSMHGAIRQALAYNLKAVVAQKLLPGHQEGVQRVPTNEIMIVNPTIRKLILKGEDASCSTPSASFYKEGMVDFTENLRAARASAATSTRRRPWSSRPTPSSSMALKGIKVAASGLV